MLEDSIHTVVMLSIMRQRLDRAIYLLGAIQQDRVTAEAYDFLQSAWRIAEELRGKLSESDAVA